MSPTLGNKKAGLTSFAVAVALALLAGCGTDRSTTSASLGPMDAHSPVSMLGVWGGEHARMTIELEGAMIQFDCGEGSIDRGIIPDPEGRFQAEGTFASGFGPDPVTGRPQQAAIYSGTISGNTMELTGTVVDTAQSLGSFNLTHSDNGHLVRCY
jgi:hypothetical protein